MMLQRQQSLLLGKNMSGKHAASSHEETRSRAIVAWHRAMEQVQRMLGPKKVNLACAQYETRCDREEPPGSYPCHDASSGFQCSHSTLEQHTLSWTESEYTPCGILPGPGSLNLYDFPRCSFGSDPPRVLEGEALEALAMQGAMGRLRP